MCTRASARATRGRSMSLRPIGRARRVPDTLRPRHVLRRSPPWSDRSPPSSEGAMVCASVRFMHRGRSPGRRDHVEPRGVVLAVAIDALVTLLEGEPSLSGPERNGGGGASRSRDVAVSYPSVGGCIWRCPARRTTSRGTLGRPGARARTRLRRLQTWRPPSRSPDREAQLRSASSTPT